MMPSRSRRWSALGPALALCAGVGIAGASAPTNDGYEDAFLVASFPADLEVPLSTATLGPGEGVCADPPDRVYLPTGMSVSVPAGPTTVPSRGVWYRFELTAPQILAISLSEAASGAAVFEDRGRQDDLLHPQCLLHEDHVRLEAGSYLLSVSEATLEQAPTDGRMRLELASPEGPPNSTTATAAAVGLPFAHAAPAYGTGVNAGSGCSERVGAWYSYVSDALRTVSIATRVERTNAEHSSIAVLEVDATGKRTALLCESTWGGARRAFTARPERRYLIGVGTPPALLLSEGAAHVFPDLREDAPILLPDRERWFSTRLATSVADEDTSCGGARSVWFKIAPTTADVRIEVRDQDGQALKLGVYSKAGAELRCAAGANLSLTPNAEPRFLRVASTDATGGSILLRHDDRYGQRISGRSPWADSSCGPTQISYIDSEVEASLAISPTDPSHLVAAWQQDRTSHGGARGLVTAASFDGGATWTTTVPQGGSLCSGGTTNRATDPWVTIGPTGIAYFTTLAYDGEIPGDGGAVYGESAMLVHRSLDGGLTWDPPVTVAKAPGLLFHDKQSIVAHPTDPQKVYLTWSQVIGTEFSNVLARSIDGGATWLPPIVLPTGALAGVGDQIEVLDDGTLVHVLANRIPGVIQAMVSTTDGAAWSPPVILGRGTGSEGPQGIRGGNFIPDVATDGKRVFVAWTTERGTWLAASNDRVDAWTRMLAVPGTERFTTSVAARADGTVAITAYALTRPYVKTAELRVAVSRDGGRTFQDAAASSVFDLNDAPVSFGRGSFLGDYAGLVATPDGFIALHPMTPRGGADLYLNRFS